MRLITNDDPDLVELDLIESVVVAAAKHRRNNIRLQAFMTASAINTGQVPE